MSGYYYHAGVRLSDTAVVWSDHTRRTQEAAEAEARRMARGRGDPIVECWDRRHGLRPGDCEVVLNAWEVRS